MGRPCRGPKLRAVGLRLIGLCRIGHGLFSDEGNDGVDLGVEAVDLQKMRCHGFASAKFPAPDERGHLNRGHGADLVLFRALGNQ